MDPTNPTSELSNGLSAPGTSGPSQKKLSGAPNGTAVLAHIPVAKACSVGKEREYMDASIVSGVIGGDGPFTEKCEKWLERQLGVKRALLVTSCTDALELAAMLLELSPGDEVIVPSFTFVSSAVAFAIHGARPVFVDVQPVTLCLDPSLLEAAITPRTRAIVIVHYSGAACDMEAIMDIANRHGVMVIEDNAHAPLGKYKGRYLGTFGALATLSFHVTKNITCGEGGALIVNDPALVDQAEIARSKGTDRAAWARGDKKSYSWVGKGSSFCIADLLAAFLYAQLECADEIQARRAKTWNAYHSSLRDWAAANGVVIPPLRPGVDHFYHIFYMILSTPEDCKSLQAHLRSLEVGAATHYTPLHLSVAGRAYGGYEGACPVSENASRCLLRLPIYDSMTPSDVSRVIDGVLSFDFKGARIAKANDAIASPHKGG